MRNFFRKIEREIKKILVRLGFRDPPEGDNENPDPDPDPGPGPNPPGDDCGVSSSPPSGMTGGFVWKETSESDGKLVVLLPRGYRKHVGRVEIIWSGGGLTEVVELGRFDGDEDNGCRPHYRFKKRGRDYRAPSGKSVYVRSILNDGTSRLQRIANAGKDLRL